MAQQVRALAIEKRCSIPRAHVVPSENRLLELLWPPHMRGAVCAFHMNE